MQIQINVCSKNRCPGVQSQADTSSLKTIGSMDKEFIRTFTRLDVDKIREPLPSEYQKIFEREPETLSPTNPVELELEERAVLSRMPEVLPSIDNTQVCSNALRRLRVLRFTSPLASIPKYPDDFIITGWLGKVSSTARAAQQSNFDNIERGKVALHRRGSGPRMAAILPYFLQLC